MQPTVMLALAALVHPRLGRVAHPRVCRQPVPAAGRRRRRSAGHETSRPGMGPHPNERTGGSAGIPKVAVVCACNMVGDGGW